MKKNIFYTTLAVTATLPSVLFAADGGGLVGCTGTNCDYDAFKEVLTKSYNFIVEVAFMVMVLAFVYAGFLYLTSGGDSGKIKKANTIFKNTALGILFVLLSYLLVDLFLDTLGFSKSFKL